MKENVEEASLDFGFLFERGVTGTNSHCCCILNDPQALDCSPEERPSGAQFGEFIEQNWFFKISA